MNIPSLTDFTNADTNPLPTEVQLLVAALLEGRVRSLAIVAELELPDGETIWIRDYDIDMDEHISDTGGFVGAMSLLTMEVTRNILEDELREEAGVGLEEDEDDDDEYE